MNKKVLTLCAAMLLCGSSLMPVYAGAVNLSSLEGKAGIELSAGRMTLTGNYKLTDQKDYLLLDEDNFVLDGDGYTFTGHIVITGKNVTVQNLHIDYKNVFTADEDGTVAVNKTAITVIADGVTINNCVIDCSTDHWLANAITVFPTSADAKISITNTEINDADQNAGGDWATAIQVVEGYELSKTGMTGATGSSASKLTNFDVADLVSEESGNKIFHAATDIAYTNWESTGVTKAIQVSPDYDEKTGKLKNAEAIENAITGSDKETNFIFKGSINTLLDILKDSDLSSAEVAVQCTGDADGKGAGNILYGEATNPDNGLAAIINGVKTLDEKVFDLPLIKNVDANENNSYLLIQKSASGDNNVIYSDANGDVTYTEATAEVLEKAATDPNYLWAAFENTDLDGNYTIYFENKAGVKFFAADNKTVNNVPYLNGVPLAKSGTGLSGTEARYYGLYNVVDNHFTANELTKRYGKYFTLAITYKNDKNKDVDVTGEFKGQLHPVSSVSYKNGEATYNNATTQTSFMLVNEEGNIIVIDTKDPQYTAKDEHGYIFTTITPKQWAERNTAASLKEHNYVAEFKIAYDYNAETTTEEVTSIEIGNYKVGLEKKGSDIILVADEEGKLLTSPVIKFKLNAGNGIEAKEWLTTPSYYKVEVINKDKKAPHYGKVLGLDEDGWIDWVAPENVDLTKPEGQFAIDNNYTFKNRENGRTRSGILIDGSLYKVEDNVYAVVTSAGIDTLRITPVTTYKSSDGFKRFTAAELNNNTYTVAMTQLSSELNIIENHNDKHRLGLDEENATEWRIEMPTVKLVDATGDFTRMAADTVKRVTEITYWVGAPVNAWKTTSLDPENDYYAPNTELQICTYVLKNTDNGEYLKGKDYSESAGNAYYVCNEDKKTATRIAFKEAGDGTVNLVPVYDSYDSDRDWTVPTDKNAKYESEYGYYTASLYLSNQKIIGGTTTLTGVLKDTYLYSAPSNDVFTINVAEAPTYKKLAQGDKIILTLKENLKDENVLFEDGEFAGMGNRLAHKDINPTLYVDTAYVNREGNFAYQYLLGVRINRVDTTYKCNVPSHGIHRADTTFGDFLVNMVDSALANKDVHNNKYQYNGEYKLAFVPGYHTNDTLFFTNKAGEVISKMEVGNGDFNIAKYAFKMIDEDENEFVVETATGYTTKYNYVVDKYNRVHKVAASVESKPAYLRWVNDNLVVTDDINNAAIFTMEDSELIATANEEISANAAVSVVATDGAVIVKGAEGKNVIVSTILGKVVANEVLNSDNETIATLTMKQSLLRQVS